jgi:esterase/lipase superfamily enzyme
MIGDQNYGPDSVRQNPLYHFSVVDHQIVNSREAFRRLISRLYPNDIDDSLLYIHGLDHTFSEAAERFGQLTVDLEYKGLRLFFSWPSDAYRTGSVASLYSSNAYINTLPISKNSRKYAAIALQELVNQNKPINIIAHSMGADIAVKAIMLEFPPRDNLQTVSLAPDPRALILAAADISTSDFDANVRPVITRSIRATVVYCAHDRALDASQQYNNSDPRLGSCATPKHTMDGVEIVAVKGPISGFSRHSYYLNTPKILEDIRKILRQNASLPGIGWREIVLP